MHLDVCTCYVNMCIYAFGQTLSKVYMKSCMLVYVCAWMQSCACVCIRMYVFNACVRMYESIHVGLQQKIIM